MYKTTVICYNLMSWNTFSCYFLSTSVTHKENERKNCDFYLHVTFSPVIRDLKIHCFSVQVQVNYPCAYG